MKTYDKYKDSHVEWIGQVPEHWEVCKLKNKYTFHTGGTPPSGQKKFYEDGTYKWANISDLGQETIYETAKHLTLEGVDYCSMDISPKGSLMYSFKLSVGQVAFCGDDMYTNEAIATFEEGKESLQYLYYMAPVLIEKNAGTNIYGALILNQDLIKNAPITLPPLSEQRAIAAYLDERCGRIDRVAEAERRRIALLDELRQSVITKAVTRGLNPNVTLKDSGVEWIGLVPEHWEVRRLKYIANIEGRIGYRGYTTSDLVAEGDGAFVVGGKNIANNLLDESNKDYISWQKYYESPEIMISVGDLIVAQRGSLGKVAIVSQLHEPATINPSLLLLKNVSCDSYYLYWYMVSNAITTQIDLLNTSTAVPMVSQNQIENLSCPLPPLSEQRAIASYLDSCTATLDAQKAKSERRIALLSELKQSIITEAVTGKVKIA